MKIAVVIVTLICLGIAYLTPEKYYKVRGSGYLGASVILGCASYACWRSNETSTVEAGVLCGILSFIFLLMSLNQFIDKNKQCY